jgi:hypothetical protein
VSLATGPEAEQAKLYRPMKDLVEQRKGFNPFEEMIRVDES